MPRWLWLVPSTLSGKLGNDNVAFAAGVIRDLAHDRGQGVSRIAKQRGGRMGRKCSFRIGNSFHRDVGKCCANAPCHKVVDAPAFNRHLSIFVAKNSEAYPLHHELVADRRNDADPTRPAVCGLGWVCADSGFWRRLFDCGLNRCGRGRGRRQTLRRRGCHQAQRCTRRYEYRYHSITGE